MKSPALIPGDLAHEFERTFGRKVMSFWDIFHGFDVVKFDEEFIKAKDGVSTAQAVKQQYGERAVVVVRRLMAI